jgi:hypothetical protein
MRRLPYLIAAAAISGFALSGGSASAAPLSSGVASGTAVQEIQEGLVQKVHGFHCRRRWSDYRGWHRHRRACRDAYFYPGFVPFFGLSIIDNDFRFRRHHRFRRHKDWWD